VALFVACADEWAAHGVGAARVDFVLRSVRELRRALLRDGLDVPLAVRAAPRRADVVPAVLAFCAAWGVRRVFCAAEFEVDELRREALLVRGGARAGVAVEVALHDDVVVPAGDLVAKASGRPYAVFAPWYRAWLRRIDADPALLEPEAPLPRNPAGAREQLRELFAEGERDLPAAPPGLRLSGERAARLAALWPAGEDAARERLRAFLGDGGAAGAYTQRRDFPGDEGATARISVYLAAGTLAARTVVREAREASRREGARDGVMKWVSEVAWRDFYRHVLVAWPHVCMFKPFKPEYGAIAWKEDEGHFRAWCEGRTGFPIGGHFGLVESEG
jgi:deoxyribodipyrimidine photo-lyase